MATNELDQAVLEKGAAGERLTRDEAYSLIATRNVNTLQQLGAAAHANRTRRYADTATYVFNMQVNPANLCGTGCTFCDYASSTQEPHAYVLSEEEILAQYDRLQPTEVHIVGGLNKVWDYPRNRDLVAAFRSRSRELHIKAYTAVEIAYFAQTEKRPVVEILTELQAAGVNALPGGGAEIFSEPRWQEHWPNKIGPREWLDIHEAAHRLNLPTNATLLFGFGDTWEERIEHLLLLRESQDASPGYQCFIPFPWQPGAGNFIEQGPTPIDTLRVLALSRLILDNIPHLKSYWPAAGIETAAAGLAYGADDMDGTLAEEKIMHLAGSSTPKGLARSRMVETIRLAGFTPVERDGRFAEVDGDSESLLASRGGGSASLANAVGTHSREF